MGLRVNLQEQVSTFPSPTLSDTTTVVMLTIIWVLLMQIFSYFKRRQQFCK